MDPEVRIDNEPSIKLNLKVGEEHSWVRLSSVWGSFTHQTGLSVTGGTQGEFHCPHCREHLNVKHTCDRCSASLVELFLNIGGKVHVCSRKGCPKHSIEVENVKDFLRIADNRFALGATANEQPVADFKLKGTVTRRVHLDTYCPHCDHGLEQEGVMRLKVVNASGEEGSLDLSPYMNVYMHRSDVELFDGLEVQDLICPHCDHTLMNQDRCCTNCNAAAAVIHIKAMGKTVVYDICGRKGCTSHCLSDKDLQLILLEDSDEW